MKVLYRYLPAIAFVILLAGSAGQMNAGAETPTPVTTATRSPASRTPTVTPPPTATPTPSPALPFVVRIPVPKLDVDFGDVNQSRNTPAKLYRRITAFAGGNACDSADLLNDRSGGFVVLQIGLPKQPAPCRQEGATVTFAVGADAEFPLQATLKLQHGVTTLLPNMAVKPPQTAGFAGPPEDGEAARQDRSGSSSWRTPILLVMLGGAASLAGIAFLLWSPIGRQLRSRGGSR